MTLSALATLFVNGILKNSSDQLPLGRIRRGLSVMTIATAHLAGGVSPQGDFLRARAAAVRRFADGIEASAAIRLSQHVTADVWMGPSATECGELTIRWRTQLTNHVADLRWRAGQLDRRAGEADVAARVAGLAH